MKKIVVAQTAKGKTIAGILRHAKQREIPVIAIGGKVEHCPELQNIGLAGIYSINNPNTPLELAMQKEYAAKTIMKTIEEQLKHNIELL